MTDRRLPWLIARQLHGCILQGMVRVRSGQAPLLSAWPARSASCAHPDEYACCSGQLDGMAAAGAVVPDEGGTGRTARTLFQVAAY